VTQASLREAGLYESLAVEWQSADHALVSVHLLARRLGARMPRGCDGLCVGMGDADGSGSLRSGRRSAASRASDSSFSRGSQSLLRRMEMPFSRRLSRAEAQVAAYWRCLH
jgi:hypothetical protein